jgi:hypothetical protein
LRAAIQSHGYAADGRQLKRAFVVAHFSARQSITLPLNLSFISANIGDTTSHAINSWPEVPDPDRPEVDRQFQCHAGIDVQRWLMLSHQIASGADSAALYKVVPH